MTRIVYVRRNWAAASRMIAEETQKRTDEAAEALRDALKSALDRGLLPIHSDTAALGESLFVQASEGSDYDGRLMAAAAAYLSNESKWLEPVRATVTPYAYEKEHFAERVAREEALPSSATAARAAVATMLAYGLFWQFGHNNVFTGHEEHRPWMDVFSLQWAFDHFANYYLGLLA